MSTRFDRQFDLYLLKAAITGRTNHWFGDLLRCWRPSGAQSENTGLRLSIRNRCLNFYRRGQSVARVGLGPQGVPWLEVHAKYVTAGAPKGTRYLRLVDRSLCQSGRPVGKEYGGPSTLDRWIRRADEFAGDEKKYVDAIVAANGAVIDLEVSAPAEKPPFRMDLVALERAEGGLDLVFWEAKLKRDSRLVSRSVPEVIQQMRTYARFLEAKGNPERVTSAYVSDCRLLHAFHGMARQLETGIPPLDPAVVAVAEGAAVTLDPHPRLVIIAGPDDRRGGTWEGHLEKLRKELTVVVLPADGALTLPRGGGSV